LLWEGSDAAEDGSVSRDALDLLSHLLPVAPGRRIGIRAGRARSCGDDPRVGKRVAVRRAGCGGLNRRCGGNDPAVADCVVLVSVDRPESARLLKTFAPELAKELAGQWETYRVRTAAVAAGPPDARCSRQ